MNVIEILKAFFKEKAYSFYDAETQEKEKLFSFLLFGWILGFPMPSSLLSLKLLPYADEEISKLLLIVRDLDDQFGKALGQFDID